MMEWQKQGNNKGTCPITTVSIKNFIWTDRGSNPDVDFDAPYEQQHSSITVVHLHYGDILYCEVLVEAKEKF